MKNSDRHYIERCLDGHPDDYGYLVQRYKSMLVAILTGRLGSKDRGEEAAQETFVRAYFNIHKLKKPDSFHAWLLGIADRVAKEHGRDRKISLREADICSISEISPVTDQKPDIDLRKAISILPDMYREVILLKYYAERSCNQIAEQIGIPLYNVTKRLSRAYALLRQSLQPERTNRLGGAE